MIQRLTALIPFAEDPGLICEPKTFMGSQSVVTTFAEYLMPSTDFCELLQTCSVHAYNEHTFICINSLKENLGSIVALN